MNEKFKETFREEAEELLGHLEDILLELEEKPTDAELVNAAFRAIHTIKGSAGMFGFEKAGRFTHDLESLLDECRAGRRAVDKRLVDLSLRARDKIRSLIAQDDSSAEFDAEALAMMEEFRAMAAESSGKPAQEDQKPKADETGRQREAMATRVLEASIADSGADGSGLSATYRIRFEPAPDIFLNGTRVLRLFDELATLGQLSSMPDTGRIPMLESLDPETCYVIWEAILTTSAGIDAIKDVFIFVEDSSKVKIELIDDRLDPSEGVRKLGEILVERGTVKPEDLGEALRSQRKLGEVLLERKVVTDSELESALVEQAHLKKVQERQTEGPSMSIRVASDKLDELVDLVGELVTMQARLLRTSVELADPGLSSIAEQVDRLVEQLRDNAMGMRMLPIGSTFNKFRRVVRDLSAELGKNVDLVAVGADTELDKTVIERLNDPLVHIIRNSLDHGIESPADRVAVGKTATGTIRLAAEHSGANVVISVSDDGKGMDLSAIRAKAIERGILGPQEQLSEADALMLVFRPGFSTARNVTSVSGRGVGMDVVKREIDSLGGSVSVESRPGKGSTVVLKIPLTLAIIEGMLVRIADEFYVLPLSIVEACVEANDDDSTDGSKLVQFRGDLIPYIDLKEFFSVPGEPVENRQIVVVNVQESRVGLVVDAVIGDNQTVIKPMGRMYRNAVGLSGATILGDGRVALIVDCMKVVEAIPERELKARSR
ncbi:MAG: chemotaxis protein CheA [Spirochaetae bacterium HGW-Spirochaetae-7]|jgi:two-component system chemotaxis sensor kinase CheA|nr:MAG: chemotaxis protein CheA [Spirochaetae bacterium HGW-Spirochaetae-7]